MRVKQRMIMPAMIFALLAVVVLAAIGCASNGSQPRQTTNIFTDEKDGILAVQNLTGVDMVLFAGRVERGIVLGGIRANSVRSFNILKIDNIPEKGAFIIRGVPDLLYKQRNGRLTESDVLYSGLVAFNLRDTKKIIKIIPGEIDETMSTGVMVSNNSRTACELRLGSPNGPAIAALPPLQQNKTIWIRPFGFGEPSIILPIYLSVDRDGTIHESVPSTNDMQRIIPVPRGGGMRLLELNNPAGGEEQINLLFE